MIHLKGFIQTDIFTWHNSKSTGNNNINDHEHAHYQGSGNDTPNCNAAV